MLTCSTGDTAQKFNAGVTQGGLSSAAADKGIDAVLHKDAGQQTVAASVGVDDFCVRQLLCIFLQTVDRSGFGHVGHLFSGLFRLGVIAFAVCLRDIIGDVCVWEVTAGRVSGNQANRLVFIKSLL